MNGERIHTLWVDAALLLKELIAAPSFSTEEDQTAGILTRFFETRDIAHTRIANNVFAFNRHRDPLKPTILLNSHHDTVKPSGDYSIDPFDPVERDGKISGLGSNDAGGSLVALIAAFLYYYDTDLKYNLVMAATAEEEISGHRGIEMLLPSLGRIEFGIVGEPTQMKMAIAEKGLLVLDCNAYGKAGHAARNEGDNAIYKAVRDIDWFSAYTFDKVSDLLGAVTMTVTVIATENRAHNSVPSQCSFVVDVRVNELYGFEDILTVISRNTTSEIKPRSLRMRSSIIDAGHPIVRSGLRLGVSCYGSPTTSDKALMPFPALKIGPGDSARSHTADEYIFTAEIRKGIELYIALLGNIIQ